MCMRTWIKAWIKACSKTCIKACIKMCEDLHQDLHAKACIKTFILTLGVGCIVIMTQMRQAPHALPTIWLQRSLQPESARLQRASWVQMAGV